MFLNEELLKIFKVKRQIFTSRFGQNTGLRDDSDTGEADPKMSHTGTKTPQLGGSLGHHDLGTGSETFHWPRPLPDKASKTGPSFSKADTESQETLPGASSSLAAFPQLGPTIYF